jgi:hypothetical protein
VHAEPGSGARAEKGAGYVRGVEAGAGLAGQGEDPGLIGHLPALHGHVEQQHPAA